MVQTRDYINKQRLGFNSANRRRRTIEERLIKLSRRFQAGRAGTYNKILRPMKDSR